MAEALEGQQPPLRPAHRRQVVLLSAGMHVGLAIVCLSAIHSLQPSLMPRAWAPYLLVALAMLICAIASRGRCGFWDGGKLIAALGAALVLRLARDPQLGDLRWPGEQLPPWLAAAYPGIATVGLLIAVVFGFLYVRTLNNYLGHGHVPPFLRAVNWSALLIAVLGVLAYFTLRRFYEMDVAYLALLIGNVIQYTLLLRLMLSVSGRTTVGALPQIYLALAILLAFGRNLIGGVVTGGGGP